MFSEEYHSFTERECYLGESPNNPEQSENGSYYDALYSLYVRTELTTVFWLNITFLYDIANLSKSRRNVQNAKTRKQSYYGSVTSMYEKYQGLDNSRYCESLSTGQTTKGCLELCTVEMFRTYVRFIKWTVIEWHLP
ncbi:hypothetical protein JTB14_002785 [Gonioctena quinquepunctata]|nr:hypothetical protein JTB14_002785 [Gonioctena quinquepunctata]